MHKTVATVLGMVFGLCASASASASAATSAERNFEAIVTDYYSRFQQPGFTIDDLLSFYAKDIDFRDPTFDITINGETEFRNLYSELGTDRTGYRDIKWTLADVIVDDERVVIAGR